MTSSGEGDGSDGCGERGETILSLGLRGDLSEQASPLLVERPGRKLPGTEQPLQGAGGDRPTAFRGQEGTSSLQLSEGAGGALILQWPVFLGFSRSLF